MSSFIVFMNTRGTELMMFPLGVFRSLKSSSNLIIVVKGLSGYPDTFPPKKKEGPESGLLM